MENTHKDYIRVSALGHSALGLYRVKVIFAENGYNNPRGELCAYWMTAETYDEYPLGEVHTLAEYMDKGECIEAHDTDIYSNL